MLIRPKRGVSWLERLKLPPFPYHGPVLNIIRWNYQPEVKMADERDAVIEKAIEMLRATTWLDQRSMLRHLADAHLLVTPEVLRCVEACRAYSKLSPYCNNANHNAEREVRAAGAALAPKPVWEIAACTAGPHEADAWWVNRRGYVGEGQCFRFTVKEDAERALKALNTAWSK